MVIVRLPGRRPSASPVSGGGACGSIWPGTIWPLVFASAAAVQSRSISRSSAAFVSHHVERGEQQSVLLGRGDTGLVSTPERHDLVATRNADEVAVPLSATA